MVRLGVANVSIALAFLISYLAWPSFRILPKGLALYYATGAVNYSLLAVFIDYALVAFLVYAVLRVAAIERHLAWLPLAHAAIALGNVLAIYAVVSVALTAGKPVTEVPSWIRPVRMAGWWLMCGGLAWLLAGSIGRHAEERQRTRVTVAEAAIALFTIAVPGLVAANLLWGKEGAIRRLAAMDVRFAALCASAGERISKPVTEAVDAVYFDPSDLITQYYRVQAAGSYSGSGWTGRIGELAVASRQIRFYERHNEDKKAGVPAYVRYSQENFRNQPVQDLQSRYAVRTRELLGLEDLRVGLKGTEIRVVDLRADETIATSTSYVSTWHLRFCGKVEPDGNFVPAAFIGRALNLKLP